MSIFTIANHRTPSTLVAALVATWIAGAAQAQFFFAAPVTIQTMDSGPTIDEIVDLLTGDAPLDRQSWDDCDLDEDLGSYDGYSDDDGRVGALIELAWERSDLPLEVGEYDDYTDDVSRLEAVGEAGISEVLEGIEELMVGWDWVPDGGFDAVDGLAPDDFGCLPEDDDEDLEWIDWPDDEDELGDDDGDDDWGDDDGFWGGEGSPFPMLTAEATLRLVVADLLR